MLYVLSILSVIFNKRVTQSHRMILMILGLLSMSVNVGYPRLNLDDL